MACPCEGEKDTCLGADGWHEGTGEETGSISLPCITNAVCFFGVRAAFEPLPNVVELWQAEEGELLLPTQVRRTGDGAGVGV